MDFVVLVCESIFCAFLVYYTIEEAIEIKKHGISAYLGLGVWSFLDIIILAIGYTGIALNIYRYFKI
jgi:polycystin 2